MSGGDRDELQLDLTEEELDAIIGSRNSDADSGGLDDDFLAGLNDLLGEEPPEAQTADGELGDLDLSAQGPALSEEELDLSEDQPPPATEAPEQSEEPLEWELPESAGAESPIRSATEQMDADDDGELEDLSSFLDEFEQGAAAGEAPRIHNDPPIAAAIGKRGDSGSGAMAEKERKLRLSESEMTGLSTPSSGGGKGIWAALGIVLALAASGAAVFVTFDVREQVAGVQEQMTGISRSVDTLAAKVDAPPAADPRVEEAVTAVRELSSQVGTISAIIEGPLSEAQTQGQEQIKGIGQRLTTLEQDVGVLRGDLDATRAKVAQSASPKEVVSIRADGGEGTKASRGAWSINLASYSTEGAADKGLAQFRKAGIAAEKYTANSQGKTWYRLRVAGFSTREDAKRFGQELESKMGLSHTWVSRN